MSLSDHCCVPPSVNKVDYYYYCYYYYYFYFYCYYCCCCCCYSAKLKITDPNKNLVSSNVRLSGARDYLIPWRFTAFKLDSVPHFVTQCVWISKFMRCVTSNGGSRIRRLLRMSKDESSRKILLTEQFLWKANWSTWLEHATKKNFWVPERNWAHDLPNTRRPLYPLSYERLMECKVILLSSRWSHVGVNPYHLSHFITELKIHHVH